MAGTIYQIGKDVMKALEKWRKFNKKRIRITVVETSRVAGSTGSVLKRITEGTIDDIFEVPPGLLLKDVSEWREQEYIKSQNVEVWEGKPRSTSTIMGEKITVSQRMIPFKDLGPVDFLE